jgi:hypothetical protein
MNTTLRTSVHTCIVTREAVEHLYSAYWAQFTTGLTLMPLDRMGELVCLKTIVPAEILEGGHIRAVFELTERVDAP